MNLIKLKSGTDIRGVASEGVEGQHIELTDEAVDTIARAFAKWLCDKVGHNHLTVAVGRDCRISGQRILTRVTAAFSQSGLRVYDCGLCTTPAMFMTTVLRDCDAALSITASHHPFNRNGLKFFLPSGGLDGSDIAQILTMADNGDLAEQREGGSIQSVPFLSEYAAYLRQMICDSLGSCEGERPLSGLKLTVDAGNGAGGFYATDVLAPLGADISGSINLEPDGMFPAHIPNPENEYAMECASAATVNSGADLGIIFDTDVDRAGAVGADGTEINRNRLVALASVLALEDCPGGTVVTDSITSSGLKVFIEQHLGGKHYRFRRGYKNVIDRAILLESEGQPAPLAIETSGHAAFKSNYFLDDGAYLITRIVIKLAELRADGGTVDRLIGALAEPAERAELRLNITEENFRPIGERVIEQLEQFAAAKSDWTIADDNREGIRVSDADGWFLLRLSVHDPVMPLNLESDRKGGCLTLAKELAHFFAKQQDLDITPLLDFVK